MLKCLINKYLVIIVGILILFSYSNKNSYAQNVEKNGNVNQVKKEFKELDKQVAEKMIEKFVDRQGRLEKVPASIIKIVYGDINNDGQEDAIANYTVDIGYPGNATLLYTAIFINVNGKLVCKGKKSAGSFGAATGEEISINRIENGIVIFDVDEFAEDDGPCCPSIHKIANYKFINNKLVKICNGQIGG